MKACVSLQHRAIVIVRECVCVCVYHRFLIGPMTVAHFRSTLFQSAVALTNTPGAVSFHCERRVVTEIN